MKFSIIHPTARVTPEFAHPWWLAAGSALQGCDSPTDGEYIVVVHHSRIVSFYAFMRPSYIADPLKSWGRFTIAVNYGRDCLVDQCNAGQLAMSGEILVGNQDDMRYPEHWDTEILKLIPDTSKLVCVKAGNDNRVPHLLTLPTIATKALIDRIGPISPEYTAMFSDWEFGDRARSLGLVIPASHIYFQHFHFASRSSEKSEMDSVYAIENSEESYRVGWETYNRRKAAGFPAVALPGFEAARRQESFATRAISFCIPGEGHRMEWEVPFWELSHGLASDGWDIRLHPDYSTYVHHTRMQIATAAIAASEQREADYMLWIDDDNTPSLATVRRMIDYLDSHPEIDGVTGWYWFTSKGVSKDGIKTQFMICCGDFCAESLNLEPITPGKLFADSRSHKPIEWAGFGCVLMRYSVQRELGPRAWSPIDSEANEFGATGDDSSFFARAREAGFKFVVDPNAFVEHWKCRPIAPDMRVHMSAPEPLKEAVEKDRLHYKGPQVDVTQETYESMEAAM